MSHIVNIFVRIYQFIFLRDIVKLANEEQMAATNKNTVKHLKVLIVMLLMAPVMAFLKLAPVLLSEHSFVHVFCGQIHPTNLTAVIMVLGTAWFMVSFGAVPKALENVAVSITMWMFMGFILSLEWLFIFMVIDSPGSLLPLFIVFWAIYIAAVKYDTMDIFKAGLDEAQLRFTRLGRMIFLKALGDKGREIEEGKEPGEE
ncbi:hypothetical protein KKC88_02310 [Patescibacteria group bacterium]|nr:hypothetical protein [Patescibacteria group bacterium]MBU1674101.1 hypothetical protein [Patescibacteria group bacterium]MBU1963084.1 hypothetical protein [Patescibacteria group bacterium]